ncbi:MAG: M24 family metallopeptidase, partial [Phycisphaerales bacterium]
MINWQPVQSFMAEHRIDGWLVWDFRQNNQVINRLLPGPPGAKRWTTRRTAFYIPATGTPALLVNALDALQYPDPEKWGITRETFISWRDLHEWLGPRVGGRRIAMEYSAGAALPVVSVVDAGTVELIRSMGAEVVSSADLIQVAVARWSEQAVRGHAQASTLVGATMKAAFGYIRDKHKAGMIPVEHEVADFVRSRFKADGLEWPDGPIVAVNEHAADPHYGPSADHPCPIRRGDWILIDMWARRPGDEHIHADITWTGFAGDKVPTLHRRVFDTVRAARDAALEAAQNAARAERAVQGWELDDAARNLIIARGFEGGIRHRTGHSLSPGPLVHGSGMNLDNLETR